VDDFAIATADPITAEALIACINAHCTTESQGIGKLTANGAYGRYNGLDVHQTSEYIKLSCATYIDRILQTHGWQAPGPNESDRHDLVPMSPDASRAIASSSPGPTADNTKEHQALEMEFGFSYRTVLGEITYAFVLCRPDIGYATSLLSRYSTAPNRLHFQGLKNICKYLRATRDWGIFYWRHKPLASLPHIPLKQPPPPEKTLDSFPLYSLDQLTGFVDAAHGTDLATRRSVTGYVFLFAGGAVAYKSKLQAIVSTSSTECEFYASVHGAKIAKYFRTILCELGHEQHLPTPLYIDNQAAINMINESRPTPRARHIDIQHFAIQEWRAHGDITALHIAGTLNPADSETKAVGSTLHHRHARRAMGHFGPPNKL
jgi:hypothetical protein